MMTEKAKICEKCQQINCICITASIMTKMEFLKDEAAQKLKTEHERVIFKLGFDYAWSILDPNTK